MTVGELIDKLEGRPYDARVVVFKSGDIDEFDTVEGVSMDDDGDCVLEGGQDW